MTCASHPRQPVGADGLVEAVPEADPVRLSAASPHGVEAPKGGPLERDQFRTAEPAGLTMAGHFLALFSRPEAGAAPLVPSAVGCDRLLFRLRDASSALQKASQRQDLCDMSEEIARCF